MLVADSRIDRRVLQSARSLHRDGWRVTVIACPNPGRVDEDRRSYPELTIRRVAADLYATPPCAWQSPHLEGTGWDIRQLNWHHGSFGALAARYPGHIIVANDLPVLPIAAAAARVLGSRLVYDAHELYPEQRQLPQGLRDMAHRLEAAFAPAADAVITVNDSIADEMARRYRLCRPSVILNAVETRDLTRPAPFGLRRRLAIPDDARILLYQGGFWPNRNLETLVRAMCVSAAQTGERPVVLVMVGPNDEGRAALASLAEELGLAGRIVHLLPAVPYASLLSLTSEADAGIIPYPDLDLNSTFCTPNKLFEFIAAGVPILANDLPELRRYVADTGFGRVAPMGSEEAIWYAIEDFFRDDLAPFRQALQRRGSEFSWEAQEPRLLQIYRAIA
jgi:glycosyltransferase involved in cell wall biosynthesis